MFLLFFLFFFSVVDGVLVFLISKFFPYLDKRVRTPRRKNKIFCFIFFVFVVCGSVFVVRDSVLAMDEGEEV